MLTFLWELCSDGQTFVQMFAAKLQIVHGMYAYCMKLWMDECWTRASLCDWVSVAYALSRRCCNAMTECHGKRSCRSLRDLGCRRLNVLQPKWSTSTARLSPHCDGDGLVETNQIGSYRMTAIFLMRPLLDVELCLVVSQLNPWDSSLRVFPSGFAKIWDSVVRTIAFGFVHSLCLVACAV